MTDYFDSSYSPRGKNSPISETELAAIIRQEIANCGADAGSQLTAERSENMNYYLGRPFGTEIEGRSQVVSTDVADTIEWVLPVLIRIFTSGDAVEFMPDVPQDTEGAKQATEYVNFIWARDNPGFRNFYEWFKDALLSKNGVIKIWWDDTPINKRERYFGLDDTAFALLVNDKEVKVSEHTEREEEIELPPNLFPPGMKLPPPQKITVHDVVITRVKQGGKVCVEAMPPEEFLISREGRTIEMARFVGHRKLRTISDLIEMGFEKDRVFALSGDEEVQQTNVEMIARNTVEDRIGGQPAVNPAMRQIWVTEGYIKIDMDGDGIAEMRKVLVAGTGNDILENVAWDMPRPFANITPIIQPHRFHGRALADLIKDIQLIKSTILRQYLDNLYLMNNQREQVIEKNIVDPQEVLSSTPGAKIRVRNGPAVFPIEVPAVGGMALEGLNYIDQIRENRTGVSPRTQGMGVDNLHDTASGERLMLNAAMGKIELIARVFAETGVKDAMRMILRLICEYQDKPRMIRLRDQWVSMDPRSWNADMDMQATVALSAGDRDQQLQHAMILAKAQSEIGMAFPGSVTQQNAMETLELMMSAMGMKGVDRFVTKPQPGQQPPQAPPDQKAQAMMQKAQLDHQADMTKIQVDAQGAQQKAAMQAKLTQDELAMNTMLKQGEINANLGLRRAQVMGDMVNRQHEIQMQPTVAAIKTLGTNQVPQPLVRLGGAPGG